MGIIQGPTLMHWEFFLSLEDDILRVSRYIDFSTDNFSCYSIELARLFLSACSEVDVVAKQVCRNINKKSKADTIGVYKREITGEYSKIVSFEVQLKRFGLKLNPWINWGGTKSPDWWSAHNDVKHRRHEKFQRASLENVLNSAGGLFVLLLYLYRDKAMVAELSPNPRLFTVTDQHFHGNTMVGDIMVTNYGNLY